MRNRSLPVVLALICCIASTSIFAQSTSPKPIRVLLVAGGCCHDYATQTQLLKSGIESRLNAVVDIAFNADKTTKATFPVYESDDWANHYDVIVHDECSAEVTDRPYVGRILKAHRDGKPAVNLHCAMHSYRWDNFREPVALGADNAGWYEMLGLQSTGHGPQSPIEVSIVEPEHPITRGLQPWTTIQEELYNNIQVYPSATGLIAGRQWQKPRAKKGEKADANAPATEAQAVVAWTNAYGPNKTRIFSTTLGHNNETVADPRYLELITRGLLWSIGKLNDDGTAFVGYAKPVQAR
jgi:type 1 glutamine amidotransferase